MTLKEKINADYIAAFKAKDTIGKSALSGLKSKILEAEKAGPAGTELSDADILKIVISTVKQRKQSVEEFTKAGRMDLVDQEVLELEPIEAYLPKQMNDSELTEAVKNVISEFANSNISVQALTGKTIGAFNKKFPGMADPIRLKEIIMENIVEKILN
jgi:uncharacterized protein YqeY